MERGRTDYERRYAGDGYYWGTEPAAFLDGLIRLRPFPAARRVLDIGCGEGKDAVYMAQQGYDVSAFDLAENGMAKARRLAAERGVALRAWVDDINRFRPEGRFDIVYSSGTLQFLTEANKRPFFAKIGALTNPHGIVCFNVFVEKPFLAPPPDLDAGETPWRTGELMTYFADWKVLSVEESIFEDDSGGTPHLHCMDTVIAERMP